MSELLAPAGDFDSLVAAISNGADAVYIGLETLSARAYAKNFSFDELNEAVKYAHLRNVKVYVTINTIVYEKELNEAFNAIKKCYLSNVDALIIQDLAIIKHVIDNYKDMEAHISTQVGIDDIYGIRLLEKLGAKRIVVSRECSIDKIREFKKQSKVSIEAFIHGALCVSFSGGCLMSGLIGMRSGNRGRCVGPCRKKYKLFMDDKFISDSYILSMKDLNTSSFIHELNIIDSLKIEGRMKSPEYVAGVVNLYRSLLDNKKPDAYLEKTFNRTFTKGYLFNEDKKDIVNSNKPNNNGYLIGKIVGKKNNLYQIKLTSALNQNDQIRIEAKNEISLPIVKLYDNNHNLIKSAKDYCFIEMKENASINDLVYKTKDVEYLEEIKKTYPKEFKRLPLDIYVTGSAGNKLSISFEYNDYVSYVQSDILEKSINKPITKDTIYTQLNKLNDTPYYISSINYDIKEDFFIPIKEINELRRKGIEELNNKRLDKNREKSPIKENNYKISFDKISPKLAVFATSEEQYQVAKEMGVEIIYYNNYVRRNNAHYIDTNSYVLIGNYGGLNYYKNNTIITDHLFNASNSIAVYNLFRLGASRVTLPHEINSKQIKDLYQEYYTNNNGSPNLEMIVYGHQELMYTKYCPLKHNGLCGKCKNHSFRLNDGLYDFYLKTDNDCYTSIYNGKRLNLIDDLYDLSNYINVFRLQFTIETKEETKEIIEKFQYKLSHLDDKTKEFNDKVDTHGYYNREVI